MNEWKELKLDELGKVARGKSKHRPRNAPELFGGKYPFVQTGDIKEANFYVTKYTETYSEVGLAQSKLWKKGTLCITIAANIAETAILGIDACFPDSIIGFIPYSDKSDVCFIKYQFDLIKKHLQSISQGTTQDNLSQGKLLRFNFKVPPLPEQQQIASILSTYDELIEINNRRIAILEQTAEQIYKEWFVRMRFPGYENTEFEKGVPKSWKEIKLKDAIIVKNGKSCELNEDGIYKVYGSNGCIGLSERYNYENVIIVGRVGAYCGAVDFGFGKVWATDNALVISLIDTKATYYYTYYLLKMLNLGNFASGSAQPLLTQSILYKMKVFLPNIQILRNFDKIIFSLFAQIRILQQQNINLKQTRDLLLPRLISGKLKVKEAEKEFETV